MPGFYAGTQMVPSRKSFEGLTREDIQKLCFQTTSMQEVPGRAPKQEYIGENYVEVHGIGQRKSKYLDFPEKKAPLINRLATNHAQQFNPLPLGDSAVNTALAHSFKTGFGTSKGPNPCPLDGSTKTEDDFIAPTTKELLNARPPLCKPPFQFTHTVCPAGDLLEKKTHYQLQYETPSDAISKSVPAKPPVPGLYIGGAPRAVVPKTANRRQFTLAAVTVKKSRSTPQLGLAPMPPVDPEILLRPRCCYMEPAK
eukprot:TRINITY_DN24771_c0_g1_i1.p1 TRINITY_DN24771_c0_g1~~TRINITY_DN24771_c0_g1_i1.p1  ORF type:complete len:254 (+),score=56.99 TRINITY_DN24771_c0_g1_i1:104-865(+)